MKKFISAAALGVAVAGAFALASCGPKDVVTTTTTAPEAPTTTTAAEKLAEKYLKNYIFEQEGKAVASNLSLPATLTYKDNSYPLTWVSDNAAIAIAAEAADGKYVGTLVRPATERATVNLTATLKVSDTDTASATYTVYVNPYDVYEIADAFSFAYNKGVAFKTFEVPTTYTYAEGINATISWAVVGENQPISVAEDGKTINVVQQETRTKVQLEATFTYNGTSTKKKYEFSVYKERTAEELFYAFYDEATVYSEAFTVRGYVVAKAGYTESYGNGYVYIQDQTGLGGYYVYRCMIENAALWDQLTIGTPVEVPMVVATIYNGLVESTDNKKTNLKIITDASVLAPLDEAGLAKLKAGVAIDDMIVTADKSVVYQTGNLVTLSSWKVTEVGKVSATTAGTALTLEKDGVTITLQTSKYGVDLKTDAANPTTSDKIISALSGIAVGDYVNVKGILNNYKGYYIMAVDADCVTKTTDDGGASTYASQSPKRALESAALATAYAETTSVDLSSLFIEGVTISVSVGDATTAVYDAETKKITFTPKADDAAGEAVTVTLTATNGKYSATKTVSTLVRNMNDEEMLAYENEHFTLDTTAVTKPGEFAVSKTGQTYQKVAAAYTITEGAEFAEVQDGKIVFKSVDGDTTVKVKATLSIGELTPVEKEFTFTVKNPTVVVKTPITAFEDGKAYSFIIDKGDTVLHATGEVANSRYLGLTDAADTGYTEVYAEKVSDSSKSFKLYFKNGEKKIYITCSISTSTDRGTMGVTEDASKATSFKLFNGMPGVTANSSDWVLTSSGTYNTLGATKLASIGSNYPLLFATSEDYLKTREEKVAIEKAALTTSATVYELSHVELSTKTTVFDDVTISYALAENEANATLENNVLTFKGINTDDVKVVVTATITCNGKTDTQEITYSVKDVAAYMTPTELITAATGSSATIKKNDAIAVTGVAYFDASGNLWVTDGTSDFEVYKPLTTGAYAAADIKAGDVISVVGTYTVYNGTHETNGNTAQILVKGSATDDQKLAVTKGELAFAEKVQDPVDTVLATKGTIFNDVTIEWALGSDSYTTTSIVDGHLQITPSTAADETVTLTATIKLGENAPQNKEFTITVVQKSAQKTKTLAYTDTSTSKNMDAKNNNAATLGLDETIFTVSSNKCSANNEVGLNKAGQLRLYSAKVTDGANDQKGSSFGISVDSTKYRIDSIKIYYGGTVASIVVGTTFDATNKVVTGTTLTPTADGTSEVEVNAASVYIQNNIANSTTACYITKIEITYTDLNFGA